MTDNVIYRTVPTELVLIDPRELRARLSAEPDSIPELSKTEGEVRAAAVCRYAAAALPVEKTGDGLLIGPVRTSSAGLMKMLEDCDSAALIAVTLGHGVDRLILRSGVISPTRALITDAVASALADGLMDLAAEDLTDGKGAPRFSPGYGDLPLSVGRDITAALGAEGLLGISFNDGGMMTPAKSITAIMGIKK